MLGDGRSALGDCRARPYAGPGVGLFRCRRWAPTSGSSSRAATRLPDLGRLLLGDGEVAGDAGGGRRTKMLKTDGLTLTIDDMSGAGGVTLEVASPAVVRR